MKEFLKRTTLKPWLACTAVFLVLCVLSFMVMKSEPQQARELAAEFMEMAEDEGIVSEDGDLSWLRLLLNNIRASGLILLTGFIPFLFLPVFSLISNALLVGAALGFASVTDGRALGVTIAGLLPHGVFEVPALCLACALGLILCRFLISKILRRGRLRAERALDFIGNICRVFVLIAVPLLIVASLVEAYITPMIMG